MLLVGLVNLCPAHVHAANPYNMGKVEYFVPVKKGSAAVRTDLDWREPVVNGDGSVSYHLPPPHVLQLLQDPTPENARVYIARQRQKAERILQAQAMLAKIQQENL